MLDGAVKFVGEGAWLFVAECGSVRCVAVDGDLDGGMNAVHVSPFDLEVGYEWHIWGLAMA